MERPADAMLRAALALQCCQLCQMVLLPYHQGRRAGRSALLMEEDAEVGSTLVHKGKQLIIAAA